MTRSKFDQPGLKPVRRLLIGLGSAGAGAEILDMAAELAGALQTELAALFVEEELLYHLSELPVASIVSPYGRVMDRLDKKLVSRAVAAQARACRRALSQRAEMSHLRWSFELRQGEALDIIAARVKEGDILLMTGMAGTITPRARIELATQMHRTPSANLIMPDQLRQRKGPVITFEAKRDRRIDLAEWIAASLGEELVIFASDESGGPLHARRTRRLHVKLDDPADVAAALRALSPHLVVAGWADRLFSDPAAAAGLLQAGGAPVLLLNF